MTELDIKEKVRKRYGQIAQGATGCGSLCGCSQNAERLALEFGYAADELAALPPGANLGLSCGNPQAHVGIRTGDVVLDLGSGAGFDALLLAKSVGPTGRVIGVDMTEAMLAKARSNVRASGCTNVEFRHGDIEQLPVDDGSIDVVVSNCVLNLCPDKDRAFREIFRVLRPGGRLAISDMAWKREPPAHVRRDFEAIVGCIGGAPVLTDYLARLQRAGFGDLHAEEHPEAAQAMVELSGGDPPDNVEDLLSVTITATKPTN